MRVTMRAIALLIPLSLGVRDGRADVLVDTGGVQIVQFYASLFNETSLTGLHQFLAGKFSVSQDFRITSIEGLMTHINGLVTVKLYGDQAGLPGPELVSADFPISLGVTPTWAVFGTNLNWVQPAGAYWIAFEPHDGVSGSMPGYVAHPLIDYAVFNDTPGGWFKPADPVGFRAHGVLIPEPATIVLSSAAIAFLGIGRCRRYNQRPLITSARRSRCPAG